MLKFTLSSIVRKSIIHVVVIISLISLLACLYSFFSSLYQCSYEWCKYEPISCNEDIWRFIDGKWTGCAYKNIYFRSFVIANLVRNVHIATFLWILFIWMYLWGMIPGWQFDEWYKKEMDSFPYCAKWNPEIVKRKIRETMYAKSIDRERALYLIEEDYKLSDRARKHESS